MRQFFLLKKLIEFGLLKLTFQLIPRLILNKNTPGKTMISYDTVDLSKTLHKVCERFLENVHPVKLTVVGPLEFQCLYTSKPNIREEFNDFSNYHIYRNENTSMTIKDVLSYSIKPINLDDGYQCYLVTYKATFFLKPNEFEYVNED
jgi:hypothetical protein